MNNDLSTGEAPKLVLVGGEILTREGHRFHELLGYAEASREMGLRSEILLTHNSSAELAKLLSADLVLEPRESPSAKRTSLADRLVAYVDGEDYPSYWAALNSRQLADRDFVLFPVSAPWSIAGVGRWLASREARWRPAVFFRFLGSEFMSLDAGRYNSRASLFRLAASDLRRCDGQERVHFFANNRAGVRAVSRSTKRRTFLVPLPKHLPAVGSVETPDMATVCIFVNARSGALIEQLPEIVTQLRGSGRPRSIFSRSDPPMKILVKSDPLISDRLPARQLRRVGAEVLPPDQTTEAYFQNLGRSSVAVLAYEPDAYRTLTSGVFAEAVSMAKVVVAPAETWMSEQIDQGRASGTTFSAPTTNAVVAAVKAAIDSIDLRSRARDLATPFRNENSSRRVLEVLTALSRQNPDSDATYTLGDEIDFKSVLDSRLFMKSGWGQNEDWGAWAVRPRSALTLRMHPEVDGVADRWRLRALVRPHLTSEHRSLEVSIRLNGEIVATWTFSLGDGVQPRWCETEFSAPLGREAAGESVMLEFDFDRTASQQSLKQASDSRARGLGFTTLSLERSDGSR